MSDKKDQSKKPLKIAVCGHAEMSREFSKVIGFIPLLKEANEKGIEIITIDQNGLAENHLMTIIVDEMKEKTFPVHSFTLRPNPNYRGYDLIPKEPKSHVKKYKYHK